MLSRRGDAVIGIGNGNGNGAGHGVGHLSDTNTATAANEYKAKTYTHTCTPTQIQRLSAPTTMAAPVQTWLLQSLNARFCVGVFDVGGVAFGARKTMDALMAL